MGLKWQ